MSPRWSLVCSACDREETPPARLATLCATCGAPWLVHLAELPEPTVKRALEARSWSLWRYREWLPIAGSEDPVSLGEGGTPLLPASRLGREFGLQHLLIKDESQNPTGSFKARGMAAAVTRARYDGATALTTPTAGNAGVALSAYGRRAGIPVTVFAPRGTPPRILEQIRTFGADLEEVEGHIGDCGVRARHHAAERGAFDVSTLREPYRIEGKKTMGLEIAEQLGWRFPDVVVYPAGGGTGLIGMWLAFRDLLRAGWVQGTPPRLYVVQSRGCAPVVRAFHSGSDHTDPWPDPDTAAVGLRVPSPLGGKLMLQALRDTGGGAVAVPEPDIAWGMERMTSAEAVDAGPEGGATVAALKELVHAGRVEPGHTVVLFNTGAGWLYRVP